MTILTYNFFADALADVSEAPLKVAFYSTDLPQNTTEYSTTNETVGTGYTAGGFAVTPTWAFNGSQSSLSLASLSMVGSLYVQSILLYRSDTGAAIAVMSTGGVTIAGQTLLINFPNPIFQLTV